MERPERMIRAMPVRKALLVLCAAFVASSSVAATTKAEPARTPDQRTALRQEQPATNAARVYSLAVARICAGALLFEEAHAIGTRAGALAVARDIRASTRRRLRRVADVPAPPALQRPIARWLSLQRRLAASYADNWVRIYETIDAARTPKEHAGLARRLQKLVHTPDALRRAAGRLELELNLPDCTGGDPHAPAGGSNEPSGPTSA
jgi:hypothetical protein